MPRITEAELSSAAFKTRLKEADRFAAEHGIDKWGSRVVWVGLNYGPLAARRYASKQNRTSKAWARFERLVDQGVMSLDLDGFAWVEGTEPWETDSLKWFITLVYISSGAYPPTDFPRWTP